MAFLFLLLAAGPFGLWLGTARETVSEAVVLASPFPDARSVAHEGTSRFFNHHHGAAAQYYALDLFIINEQGRRASGFWPSSLDAYYVYGAPVAAPCAGEIVIVEDGRPDLAFGTVDKETPGGNVVGIACKDVTVLLAHLQPGSLIGIGRTVAVGDVVGRAGNSGNTHEPHLHLHAVRGRTTDLRTLVFKGEGLPVMIGERLPSRNDVIPAGAGHDDRQGRIVPVVGGLAAEGKRF